MYSKYWILIVIPTKKKGWLEFEQSKVRLHYPKNYTLLYEEAHNSTEINGLLNV